MYVLRPERFNEELTVAGESCFDGKLFLSLHTTLRFTFLCFPVKFK